MDQDLEQLEAFAQGLIENLSSAARKSLSRKIAIDLRASQAQRIEDQRNPDGSKFEARKPQKRRKQGRIRRAMFAKIRLNRHLKYKATEQVAEVSFSQQSDRIAKVHQFGLRDRVSRIRTLTVQYPVRELLGFSNADKEHIKDQVIDHLAK
jgi:phage virion morphogenesis protein